MFCFLHGFSSHLLQLSPSSACLVTSLLQCSFEVPHVVPVQCLQLCSLVLHLHATVPMVSTTCRVGISPCLVVLTLFCCSSMGSFSGGMFISWSDSSISDV